MNLVENGFVGTAEESESGTNGESSTDIYIYIHTHTHTLSCVKQKVSGKLLNNTGSPAWRSVMTWRGGVGGGQGASREGIYIHTKL